MIFFRMENKGNWLAGAGNKACEAPIYVSVACTATSFN
jgi:hypothetical protein